MRTTSNYTCYKISSQIQISLFQVKNTNSNNQTELLFYPSFSISNNSINITDILPAPDTKIKDIDKSKWLLNSIND